MPDPDWIPHDGGPCPVPPDTIVIAVLEDGYELAPMRADELDWEKPLGDLPVRYRVQEAPA